MASYKLNDAAKDDIKRIYQRGVTEFGEAQADIYYAALFDRFDSVAARPYLYPAVDHKRLKFFNLLKHRSIRFRIA